MKKNKKPLSITGSILLALALTLALTGAAGLGIYFYQSPESLARITAPMQAGARQLSDIGQSLWASWSGAASTALRRAAADIQSSLQTLASPPEPELDEIQLVDGSDLAPPPRSSASFTITALAARNGQEFLTGGIREIVYYDQTSERWANELYGSDSIGGYGCGPTVMAMAVSTMTGEIVDPAQMAQHCVDHGYWAKKQGSYRTIVSGAAQDFGLACTSLPPEEVNYESLTRHLASGGLVVALMGPGHFTNGGHFIILRGVTLDGSVLVADPASQERSLTTWDLDLILSELSASRDSGGPLWLLSQNFF